MTLTQAQKPERLSASRSPGRQKQRTYIALQPLYNAAIMRDDSPNSGNFKDDPFDPDGNLRILKRVYDDGIDRDDGLEELLGPPRRTLEEWENDDEQAADDAWGRMTGLQRFVSTERRSCALSALLSFSRLSQT